MHLALSPYLPTAYWNLERMFWPVLPLLWQWVSRAIVPMFLNPALLFLLPLCRPYSVCLTLSRWKDHQTNPSVYCHGQPLEEVQSLELIDLIVNHDIFWANNITKLASKASHIDWTSNFNRCLSFENQSFSVRKLENCQSTRQLPVA